MDSIDHHLLRLLQKDARQSKASLAQKVGLSTAACAKRVARFWSEGYASKMIVVLNKKRFLKPVTCIALIELTAPKSTVVTEFERLVEKYENITKAYALSGDFDYMLMIKSETIEDYFEFATTIFGEMSNVRTYKTLFVLKGIKDEFDLPDFCLKAPKN